MLEDVHEMQEVQEVNEVKEVLVVPVQVEQEVEAHLAGIDAPVGHVAGLGHVVVVGVVEQGLAGDAAHVEAGAAQRRVLLDTHSLHTQLRRLG